MAKIIVSYTENWDCEGYHTTQNIKLPKEILRDFNGYLRACIEPIKKKHVITNEEMNLVMYGHPIDNLNRCLHLTQLRMLYSFLNGNNIDCSRIKTDRNTMLFVC